MTEKGEVLMSSRLLRTEITRVLRRVGQPLSLRDRITDHLSLLPLENAVLLEAEAIIPAVQTLDAIHLASALRSGAEEVEVVTHDRTMAAVAKMLGLPVSDPVTDNPGMADGP